MKDNKKADIMKNYKEIKTEKGKECYLEKNKYILHYSNTLKNGDKIFRCKYYRDKNLKCKAFLKISSKGEFVSNEETHSCVVDEKKVQNIKIMNEIKDNISKDEIIYNVKPRELFESSIRKAIKRKNDEDPDENEIKEEENHISIKNSPQPYFGNIKSSLYRLINKNIPKDIENLNELPADSEYYKTLKGEIFLFYKTDHLLIFMSPNQANLLYEYNQHVFIDGTFYAAPKCSYQIVTLRIHNIKEDLFHTIAYGILIDKSLNSYIEFLDNIKTYSFNNRENKRDMNQREPLNIHCDFEQAIIGAIRQVYPNSEIKLCLWHLFRNLEINRKKIYGSKENQSIESLNIFKRIQTLCYIDPNYVKDCFAFISEDAEEDNKDDKFVNEYFKKTYLEKYNIKDWNYFKIFDHRTNNACESYHHILNSKFNSKPSIWKFINVIRNEENSLLIEINNIKNGVNFKKKKRGIPSFEYMTKKYYDIYDEEISKIIDSNLESKKDKILNIWYKALLEFPLYDYNS